MGFGFLGGAGKASSDVSSSGLIIYKTTRIVSYIFHSPFIILREHKSTRQKITVYNHLSLSKPHIKLLLLVSSFLF